MVGNGKRSSSHHRFCLTHNKWVITEKDLYGREHHFEAPTVGVDVAYRMAMRDRNVLHLHALGNFMCYGDFTQTPPPPPLTEEEWDAIFMEENYVS